MRFLDELVRQAKEVREEANVRPRVGCGGGARGGGGRRKADGEIKPFLGRGVGEPRRGRYQRLSDCLWCVD